MTKEIHERDSVLFRRFIARELKVPRLKVATHNIDSEVAEAAYGEYTEFSIDAMRYTNLKKYHLIDIGRAMGWYNVFTIMARLESNIALVFDDDVFEDGYWDELPVRLKREALNIDQLRIPMIDRYEVFLKSAKFAFMCEVGGLEIRKVYRANSDVPGVVCWGLLLAKR